MYQKLSTLRTQYNSQAFSKTKSQHQGSSFAAARAVVTQCYPGCTSLWGSRVETVLRDSAGPKETKHAKSDVTRDDSQRRFLAQHSVAMLEQCCNYSKQCRNNVATLCCAKIVSCNITFKKPKLYNSCQHEELSCEGRGDWEGHTVRTKLWREGLLGGIHSKN